jgi:hypothetical protein
MTRRIRFLHVGLPKTGTSYLQSIMWQSREALAAHGLGLVPSKRGAPFQLMLAVCDQLSAEMDPPRAFTALRRFRQEVAQSGWTRTLTSQELLGAAEPPQIAALLEALADDETHVIVTVRDLAGFLPSAWQQHVKARGVLPFETYLDEFAASGNEIPHPAYDLRGVLDRWGALVPPERIHVVTVPRRGTPEQVLLERFCRVLDVDPTALNTEMPTPNASLGLVQAELLRRVNVELGDRLPHPRAGYREQGKVFLAGTVLSAQRGTVARLPHRMAGWCDQASQAMIARLSVSGFDIVGDLADLVPDASAFTDDRQAASDQEIAAAATSALADVLAQRSADAAELEHLRARLRGSRRRTRAQSPPDQPRTS